LISIRLLAAIAIEGKPFADRQVLMVGDDVDIDTARMLIRIGRAVSSEDKPSAHKNQSSPKA
ncbi:MAG: hypothetical protein ACREXT_10945, partial [Gammaproteobacteria bacterium]